MIITLDVIEKLQKLNPAEFIEFVKTTDPAFYQQVCTEILWGFSDQELEQN